MPERPDFTTEEGRLAAIRYLNERLPTKRVIAQGRLRNEDDDILLCELTYKREWDLPGGVVDPHESPATCVEREIHEELGLDVRAGRLLAVNWLPPWRGWDDAVLFLFDLGRISSAALDPSRFLAREIAGAHWCPMAELEGHVAPYTATLLAATAEVTETIYVENSAPRDV
ncbi:MAG: NUDIX hydrolase [Tetrasphaera sp.]|jgi:8-oxo-dGTP diphosphatase|nr:NUDIX hydrolase [Tetrasphaera sp.]